jgi:hypothetical protein
MIADDFPKQTSPGYTNPGIKKKKSPTVTLLLHASCRISNAKIIVTMSARRKCRVCKRACTWCSAYCESEGWCHKCKAEGLIANFNNWTSGNGEIDAFIQETQKRVHERNRYLEWIDPQQITDIKHIADGGFGSVYLATWKNAPAKRFKQREWMNDAILDGKVALKVTNSDISTFLNEVNKQTSFSNVNNRLLIKHWCLIRIVF